MTDLATIRKALTALRHLTRRYRYGGLWELCQLAEDALEALDRIERPGLL